MKNNNKCASDRPKKKKSKESLAQDTSFLFIEKYFTQVNISIKQDCN